LSRSLWLAAACAALLAGCGGVKPKPVSAHLALDVSPKAPAALPSGTVVMVTARAEPPTQLAWVSGTVQILGAKTLALRPNTDGKTWYFKTMVPPLVRVPAGKYELKAWGRTQAGEPVEGLMQYEVK
jgi:hypothetical protein